jgi:hypothetical protein
MGALPPTIGQKTYIMVAQNYNGTYNCQVSGFFLLEKFETFEVHEVFLRGARPTIEK